MVVRSLYLIVAALVGALVLASCASESSRESAAPDVAVTAETSASPSTPMESPAVDVTESPTVDPSPLPRRIPNVTVNAEEWLLEFPPEEVVDLAAKTEACPSLHLSTVKTYQFDVVPQVLFNCGKVWKGREDELISPPRDYANQSARFLPDPFMAGGVGDWRETVDIRLFGNGADAKTWVKSNRPEWEFIIVGNLVISSVPETSSMRRVAKRIGAKVVNGGTKYVPPKETPRPKPSPVWLGPIDGIEYQWLKPKSFNCSYGDVCWGIKIRPVTNCDRGVYMEINIIGAGGEIIGWSNDSIPALGAGRTARLIFESFETNAKSAEVASVSCRSS